MDQYKNDEDILDHDDDILDHDDDILYMIN